MTKNNILCKWGKH